MVSVQRAIIITSILISLVVITAYLLILDHAATYVDSDVPPCSLAQFDPNCSPSGWMSFLIGDLVIAIALGFFLHYMGVQSSIAISRTTSDIKKILDLTKKAERRRTLFISQAMKNHFGVLLLAMGLMNRLLMTAKSYDDIKSTMREQRAGMERTIQRAHETLIMSADLMDPKLLDEMTNILYKLELVKVDLELGNGFPDYKNTRDAIKHCTAKLDASIGSDTTL